MAFNAIDIGSYRFSGADGLLLDANIWLRIYGPNKPRDWQVAAYSKAFLQILLAKACVHIDVLVVSEFVNRYARLRHELAKSDPTAPKDFKAFRQSVHFPPIAQDIASALRKMLANAVRIESGFERLDVAKLITEFERSQSDFNDLVLVDICKTKNLKLVTHDADFKGRDLTVITANKGLLS